MSALDMDQAALNEALAEAVTAAPHADAPSDYLHRRGLAIAAALLAVNDGEHPDDVLAAFVERLEEAARPVSDALMVWRPAHVPA